MAAISFPKIESAEKRFADSVIKFDELDPIRDFWVGLMSEYDTLSDEIKTALKNLNPLIAIGDELSSLGKRVDVIREPGESDTEYRKRVLVSLRSKIIGGTDEAIILICQEVAGQTPTIEKQQEQGWFIRDEDRFLSVQDYQDNGDGDIIDDESGFADTQDHQDNSTSATEVFDVRDTTDPFFIRVTVNSGSFDGPGLRKLLLAIKSGRDIMQVVVV